MPLFLSPPLLRWKPSSDFWLSFRYFSKAVAAAAIDLAYIVRKRQLNFSFTSDRPGEIRPRARERRGAASCVWLSVGQLIAYCFTISLLIKCVRRRWFGPSRRRRNAYPPPPRLSSTLSPPLRSRRPRPSASVCFCLINCKS